MVDPTSVTETEGATATMPDKEPQPEEPKAPEYWFKISDGEMTKERVELDCGCCVVLPQHGGIEFFQCSAHENANKRAKYNARLRRYRQKNGNDKPKAKPKPKAKVAKVAKPNGLKCDNCGRKDFGSKSGLTLHIKTCKE